MSSIVLELQQEALDRRCSVADLLRRALVVAKKLKLAEFEKWLGNELAGYEGNAEPPAYRILHGQVKAFNQFRGWIPIAFETPEESQTFSSMACGQSVAQIEGIVGQKDSSSTVLIPFPPRIEQALMQSMQPMPLQPMLHLSRVAFVGILDAVRNTVLNWALRLEGDGILGQGLSFSSKEQSQATASEYHVNNFYGSVSQSQFAEGAQSPTQVVVSSELNIEEVKALIAKVKDAIGKVKLEPERASEVRADIATVESQVSSPKPKVGIIRQSLLSIQKILEGAGGNVLGTLIVELGKMAMRS